MPVLEWANWRFRLSRGEIIKGVPNVVENPDGLRIGLRVGRGESPLPSGLESRYFAALLRRLAEKNVLRMCWDNDVRRLRDALDQSGISSEETSRGICCTIVSSRVGDVLEATIGLGAGRMLVLIGREPTPAARGDPTKGWAILSFLIVFERFDCSALIEPRSANRDELVRVVREVGQSMALELRQKGG